MDAATDLQHFAELVEASAQSCIAGGGDETQDLRELIGGDDLRALLSLPHRRVRRGNIFAVCRRNGGIIVKREERYFLNGLEEWADREQVPGRLISSIFQLTPAGVMAKTLVVIYFLETEDEEAVAKPTYQGHDMELATVDIPANVRVALRKGEADLDDADRQALAEFVTHTDARLGALGVRFDTSFPHELWHATVDMGVRYLYLIPCVYRGVTTGGVVVNSELPLALQDVRALKRLGEAAVLPAYIVGLCDAEKAARESRLAMEAREYFPASLLEAAEQLVVGELDDPYGDKLSPEVHRFVTSMRSINPDYTEDSVLASFKTMWGKVAPASSRMAIQEYYDFFSEHEKLLFVQPTYRDHLIHQMFVFLAGMQLIRGTPGYRATIIQSFQRYLEALAVSASSTAGRPDDLQDAVTGYFAALGEDAKERLIRWVWFISSTFHDMAYPVEMSEFWLTYIVAHIFEPKKRVDLIMRLKEVLGEESAARGPLPLSLDIRDLLLEKVDALLLNAQPTVLSRFLAHFPGWLSKEGQLDVQVLVHLMREAEHGLFSSLVLYCKLLAHREKDNYPQWEPIVRDGDQTDEGIFHLAAALSLVPVAFHSPKVWELLALDIQYEEQTVAFVLAFVDLLQESNRKEMFLGEPRIIRNVRLEALEVAPLEATAVLSYYTPTDWQRYVENYYDKKHKKPIGELARDHLGSQTRRFQLIHAPSEILRVIDWHDRAVLKEAHEQQKLVYIALGVE
ncbi:MAG: hypothetical protein ACOC6F_01715 [bacterium]